MRRVFLCPGASHLVTAVAAAKYHDHLQGRDWRQAENYLVVDNLFTPQEENGRFANLIVEMARHLASWRNVSYLSPSVVEKLAVAQRRSGWQAATGELRRIVGIEEVDSLLLSGNWMFTNQLLLNAYGSAEKISYGDGYGIYGPGPEPAEAPGAPRGRWVLRSYLVAARRRLRTMLSRLGLGRRKSSALPVVDFDLGYFAQARGFKGQLPPMPSRLVESSWPVGIFECLTECVPADLVKRLRSAWPCVFLLGENLSEAGEMRQETEIAAWLQLLVHHQVDRRATLVYKPHPRDGLQKIERMGGALRELFSSVIVLDDERLARLPFELVLLAAFPLASNREEVDVVTIGTSVLSLKYYFNFDAKFGWGPQLSENAGFSRHFVEANRAFEQFVRSHHAPLGSAITQPVRSAA